MEPIEVGERIKNYREQLGITREQLAAGKISSSLIKQIEQGKRKLTPNKAAIIAAILNKAAIEKGVQFEITANDLLISEKNYAEIICKNKLSNLEKIDFSLENYLDILKIAEKYEIYSIELEVYNKIFYYLYDKDIYLLIEYLKKELSLCIKLKLTGKLSDILNKLGVCYYNLKKYNIALQCFHHCYYNLEFLTNRNDDMEAKILYNLALNYRKLNKRSTSLYYLDKFFSLRNTKSKLMNQALILKANLFFELEKYEQALSIYTYIADQNTDYMYLIQHNIAAAFNKLNRVDESIKFLTKSINNQLSSPSPDTTISLIDMADNYKDENMKRESIVFYEYALDNSLKFEQLNEALICFETLFDLYSEIKKTDRLQYLFASLNKLLSNDKTTTIFKDKVILLLKKFK